MPLAWSRKQADPLFEACWPLQKAKWVLRSPSVRCHPDPLRGLWAPPALGAPDPTAGRSGVLPRQEEPCPGRRAHLRNQARGRRRMRPASPRPGPRHPPAGASTRRGFQADSSHLTSQEEREQRCGVAAPSSGPPGNRSCPAQRMGGGEIGEGGGKDRSRGEGRSRK